MMNINILKKCISLTLLSTLILSCSEKFSTASVKQYCIDENTNKEEILAGVEKSLSKLASGIESKNAREIFSIILDQEESIYIRDGHLNHGVTASIKGYQSFFDKHPEHERKFYFKEKNFDILHQNTVFFSGIGVIETYTQGKKEKDWEIAYSIVWLKSDKGWKASNMHISW